MAEPAPGAFADDERRPPPPQAPDHGPDPDAIAAAYGLGDVRAPLQFAARGELGRIWRLETTTGSWAIKELLMEQTEASAARDVAFQQHALAHGVRMPVPRARPNGEVLAEVAGSDGGTRAVRAYSWVDLAPGPRTASPTQAAEQLGHIYCASFPDDRQMDPWYYAPVEDERWTDIVAASRTAGAPWAEPLAAAVPDLVRANAVVAAGQLPGDVGQLVCCHLDFNPMNVLLDRAGRAVVVDWENSGPAPLDQELASAIAEFVPDAADLPPFLEAYLSAGGVPVPLTVSSFTLTLAVQAHLLRFYVRRSLDGDESPENRQRSTFWVQDICENLFTLEHVEAWVSASRSVLG